MAWLNAGDMETITALTVDETFLTLHLPAFVGKEEAKWIDENATSGEMLQVVLNIVNEVFQGFKAPDVEAALGNLPEAQAADK